MTPSRRQFVATIASVPFLAQAAGAQRRQPAAAADPVLDQVLADLRILSAEFDTQPQSRKSTMRAMESTLSVGAAHLAAHYDAGFRQALRRRQARSGRAALVQDLLAHAKHPQLSHDAMDAAITRLDQRGLSGSFRDVQETIRRVRTQAPDQIQAAGLRTLQYDYCADLNWMIGLTEMVVAITCGIAILEPTVGGEIACGALTLALGLLLAQRALFC